MVLSAGLLAVPAMSRSGASSAEKADSTTGKKSASQMPTGAKCPPAARVDSTVDVLHGVSVPDPYRWLEDQQSPETRAWIDAENACTRAALDKVPGRAQIAARLAALMKVESFGLPIERRGLYFFSKRAADQDLSILYLRRGLTGKDEVLVDPLPMSPDHTTSVEFLDVSRDGSLVAYHIRAGGQDESTAHFLRIGAPGTAPQMLPDALPRAVYFGFSIAPNNRDVYYSRTTAAGPRVFHHVMGTDAASDAEIFGKGYGPEKIIGADLSDDGRYLLLSLFYGSGSSRSELYFKDLKTNGAVQPIVNDLDSLFYGGIRGGHIYIQTNWGAPKWRIFRADPGSPERSHWKELVPESDAAIESFGLYGGKVYAQYVRNAAAQIKLFGADGKAEGEMALPALGSVSGSSGDWASANIFINFESYNIPASVYRYDLGSRALESWAAPKVPFDSAEYSVQQVWYPSKDGTKIPMFLFGKKGAERSPSTPVLMHGYGGFDISTTPAFSPLSAAWVEAGGIYADANIRGGGEFGEAWHKAGMMEKKQTVFDDFAAAAEWLEANHYTSAPKMSIIGRSNGGLLMGAMLTQRPDLFQAVVCGYPLLDMLRYQKFLVGSYWVPEYGSADDAEQFKYLIRYSPYHNVKAGADYPAVLFITGDNDTRVAPLHARKMAARLQAAERDNAGGAGRPILLLYDTKSGHSGGRPVSNLIEENTDILAFLFAELDVKK